MANAFKAQYIPAAITGSTTASTVTIPKGFMSCKVNNGKGTDNLYVRFSDSASGESPTATVADKSYASGSTQVDSISASCDRVSILCGTGTWQVNLEFGKGI